MVVYPQSTSCCAQSASCVDMIKDYLVGDWALYKVIETEGLVGKPLSAVEAEVSADGSKGFGIVASGGTEPLDIRVILGVKPAARFWAEWGNGHKRASLRHGYIP